MPRPRKKGPRSKSGRLSRAYQGPARDNGTPELRRHKLGAVNGAADPALSATPASILFAHGILNRDQLAAADDYHRAYRRCFSLPDFGTCLLGDGARPPLMSEDSLERARQDLDAMVRRLSPEQKMQIDNLVISAWIPTWFFSERGIGRPLATDAGERAALLSGLDALAG
jgi:hypothetical protein